MGRTKILALAALCLSPGLLAGVARANPVYSFPYPGDEGRMPLGGLVSTGEDLALYGTTVRGGTASKAYGTVYRLLPPVGAKGVWRESVLHSFPATTTDGASPSGDLLPYQGGVLAGTTSSGGANNLGTVYTLRRPATGAGGVWTETVLHSFAAAEGTGPVGGVISDPADALYGVTEFGGPQSTSAGNVYRLMPPSVGQPQWTEQTLFSFNSSAQGSMPAGSLLRDTAGNLFGITEYGGTYDSGVLYELSPPPAGQTQWIETILHEFTPGPSGRYPVAGLVMDAHGTIFGTTASGGLNPRVCHSCGVVFKLDPPAVAGQAWAYTPIFLFNGTDGGRPAARLTLTPDGDLYGTTLYGGAVTLGACKGGCGTMFKLTHPGQGSASWTETYIAVPGRYAGRELGSDLFFGFDNAFYTTAETESFQGQGSVLRVTPDMFQSVGTEP